MDRQENKIIEGDILDIADGIICHQVNCQNVMGAGLALQIRKKYPQIYIDYKKFIKSLGDVIITKVTAKLIIASLCGQFFYGRNQCFTDYQALRTCFNFLKQFNQTIYVPYKIGCGLAGGNWNIIQQIIAETLPDAIIVKKEVRR